MWCWTRAISVSLVWRWANSADRWRGCSNGVSSTPSRCRRGLRRNAECRIQNAGDDVAPLCAVCILHSASCIAPVMISTFLARIIPALGRQHRRLSEQSEALTTLRQRVRDLLGRAKEQERLLSLATEGSAELQDYARHHRAATRR